LVVTVHPQRIIGAMIEPQEDRDWGRVVTRHAVGAGLVVPVIAWAMLPEYFHLYRRGWAAQTVGMVASVAIDWCGVFFLGQLKEGKGLKRPGTCVGPAIVLYAAMRAVLLLVALSTKPPLRQFIGWAAYSGGVTGFFALITWRVFTRAEAERTQVGFPVALVHPVRQTDESTG
jgi:hypothetical protein